MWFYLIFFWILTLAGGAAVAYSVGRRRAWPVFRLCDHAVDEAPGFDLDAVRAAGDRAYLAVRADQALRAPRPRARHLAVVA